MQEELKKKFEIIRIKYTRDSTQRFLSRSAVRAIIWDKSNGWCWYCGRGMNPFRDFCIDHLVPIIDGGRDDFENLVPACRYCNSIKQGWQVNEFRIVLIQNGYISNFNGQFFFERYQGE